MFENLFARRGLSFERLHSFLEVAAAGGIAKAACGDPVRQSQFSRQIGELEEFFGVRLIRRAGRGIEATAAGTELAALLHAHFRELEAFRSRDTSAPASLTIGAGDSLITWLIIPRLPAFAKTFPDTVVDLKNLRSAEIVDRLAHGRLDFGLAREGLVRAPLASAPLGSLPYGLFVPHTLADRFGHLSPRELLLRLPIAALGSDGEHFERLTRSGAKGTRAVNIRLITESFPQAARAVASGIYAAVLPLHATPELTPAIARVFPLDFLKAATRRIALVWNPRSLRSTPSGERIKEKLLEDLTLSTRLSTLKAH